MISTGKPEVCNFYFSSRIVKLFYCYFPVVIHFYVIWSLCVNQRRIDRGLMFCFHYVGLRAQTQAIRFSGQHLYLTSHLSIPVIIILNLISTGLVICNFQ